eukprot:11238760-Karenia_brevis.AAC.1
MLEPWLSHTGPKARGDPILIKSAISGLDHKDQGRFAQQAHEAEDEIYGLTQERQSSGRSKWVNYTPFELRALVPGKCRQTGVYIVWQRSARQWNAYYPEKVPYPSHSKRWGGAWSELDALWDVVQWLWTAADQ